MPRLKELERTRELAQLALAQWDANQENAKANEAARAEVLRTEREEQQALTNLSSAVQRIGEQRGLFSVEGGHWVASKALLLRIEETIGAEMEELVALGKITESGFYQNASTIASKMVYASEEYQPFANALGAARDAVMEAQNAYNLVREPRDALRREIDDLSDKMRRISKAQLTREVRVLRENAKAEMSPEDGKRIEEALAKLSGLIYGRVMLKGV